MLAPRGCEPLIEKHLKVPILQFCAKSAWMAVPGFDVERCLGAPFVLFAVRNVLLAGHSHDVRIIDLEQEGNERT